MVWRDRDRVEFTDGGRIIVNRHFAAQEIRVAAKSGGNHLGWDGAHWINTREGSELFASLSRLVREGSGRAGRFALIACRRRAAPSKHFRMMRRP